MENTTVLYYNMGASSTQVSIVTYSNFTVKEGGKNKTVGTFEVRAKSWDASLGGDSFDMVIAEHFAAEFEAKHGAGFRTNPKPVAKLRAQASKTKHVLSANAEIPVKINSLFDDTDYSTLITRDQFEGMAAGLLARVTAPIDRALRQAGLALADLHAVEMLGGAQRVPAVQRILGEYFGARTPLGVHLNADEAPALGAAFEAANISTAFKVRKTGMTDYSPFAVNVGLSSLPLVEEKGLLSGLFGSKKSEEEAAAGDAWTKSTTVFKAWSRLESKKVIAFHHDRDVRCAVSYSPRSAEGEGGFAVEPLPEGTPLSVATFNVTGVAAFAQGMGAKGLKTCGSEGNPKPKVVLHFKLDASGLVALAKAEVHCEQVNDKDGDKDSDKEGDTNAKDSVKDGDKNATEAATSEEGVEEENAEGDEKKGDEEAKDADTEEKDEKKEEDKKDEDKKDETKEEKEARLKAEKKAKKEAAKKEKAEKEAKDKAEKEKAKAKKEAKKKERADLMVVEDFSGAEVLAVSPEMVAESKDKLGYLQVLDDLRFSKLEAKNGLEAYLYAVKGKMEDEAEALGAVTTEEQREALLAAATAALEWLEEDGYDAEVPEYKEKRASVTDLADPIYFRLDEATARPEAVAMAEKRLKDIRLLVAKWEEKMPQVTEEERGDVLALVAKAEAWLEGKVAAQAAVAGHEAPAFTAAEVSAGLKPTANLVTKLSRKPKPKPVLNLTNATNATDANATATVEETTPLEEDTAEAVGDKGDETAAEGEGAAEDKEKDEL